MYTQFYVNVTFVHYYNYSLEQSKSFSEIRGDIQEEIRQRSEWLTSLIDWSNLSSALVFFILIFKAYVYRIRYMTADHFDNVYISHHVREIDDRRSEMGKETILPLTIRERMRYVNTFSVRMAAAERRKFAVAGMLLLISGLQMGFNMLMDYALFRLLEMMRFYGSMTVQGQIPAVIQIQVKGSGVMADMYRQLVSQFDPLMKSGPEFDIAKCLPNPVPIDLDKYRMIGLLYLLCVVMALGESYGLRLRHLICGAHHPGRERLRAIWLYNKIIRARGGLRGLLRRQIRRRVYGDDTLDEVSLLDQLVARHRWIAKIAKLMGYVRVHCIGCGGKVEEDDFKRCATPRCKGIYCLACFEDLGNLCSLCMKPVEYEDVSDFSEEKDSSEEDISIENIGEESVDESSDDEDYDYQYEDQESSDNDESSMTNIRGSKTIRNLATIEDFGEDIDYDDDYRSREFDV